MIQSHYRKIFRANLDDIENLSYGRGAKKQRGTGSRFTCHRLNRDERRTFDQAKRDGFLTVRGTGYRKNRKGSPVANTFRQRCDALAQPCVTIEKRSDIDRLVVDFSTLRVQDDSSLVLFFIEAVFGKNYPDICKAFLANNRKTMTYQHKLSLAEVEDSYDIESDLFQIENTTCRPIHWEAVKTKPIWGVDERLLAVNCEREVARSIALDIMKVVNSPHFMSLQADAEAIIEFTPADEPTAAIILEQQGREESKLAEQQSNTIKLHEGDVTQKKSGYCMTGSQDGDDTDCIDWDDI